MWLGKEEKMEKEKKVLSQREQTRQMTILAMFIAIIAVLSLVPNGAGGTLGFVKIGANIEATIIHIPVLIGAALLGRKFGIYLGLAFGILSNIAAFIYLSPMFVYPWVAVLPRFIFGLLIYDVTRLFVKMFRNKYLGVGTSFFVLTLIHTAIVLPMMWTGYALAFNLNLFESLGSFVALLITFLVPVASLIEMIIAAVVGSVIVIRLAKSFDLPKSYYLKGGFVDENSY